MATLNAAEWFRLHGRGGISPGKRADLLVFSNLKDFHPEMVYAGGKLVAQDGAPTGDWSVLDGDDVASQYAVLDTVHVEWEKLSFAIPVEGDQVRVIGVVPDQVVTEHLVERPTVAEDQVIADPKRDQLKLAVVERHRGTGNVGLGLVRGLGLKRGALAGSVGHDAHNLTIAGCDDASMMTAARAVGEMGGGLVAAVGDEVLATAPLPIAGLMSDQPVEIVREQMDALVAVAHELGSPLHDPFMTLGFLALEVIPALKLTDQGLVDVDKFDFVPLWAE